jgi:hypothetical protein
MIRYQKLSYNDAKNIIMDYEGYDDVEFADQVKHWMAYDVSTSSYDESYSAFRKELLSVFKATLAEADGKLTNRSKYMIDLKVGLKLYQLMPLGKDFSIIQANDDDLWRYISVKVMPDITYIRNPDPDKGSVHMAHKRFYSHTRRIWLKTLWWYIHLSWQGTPEATYEVLKDNFVDNINKLIETPGRGYRLSLFRNMMLEYSKTGPHHSKDFAAFTKLNNAKCVSVEPELTAGGVSTYAQQLLAEVARKKEVESVVN